MKISVIQDLNSSRFCKVMLRNLISLTKFCDFFIFTGAPLALYQTKKWNIRLAIDQLIYCLINKLMGTKTSLQNYFHKTLVLIDMSINGLVGAYVPVKRSLVGKEGWIDSFYRRRLSLIAVYLFNKYLSEFGQQTTTGIETNVYVILFNRQPLAPNLSRL